MSTNGLLLNRDMAHHLKAIGVDKVKISVDSIDADEYANSDSDEHAHGDPN